MYKFDNGQISIYEFGQPVGMKLHKDNRWVKKAMTIPWDAIEQRYAALFTNQKDNVAKPLRLGLDACIIQAEYGYSDVEITLQIQEAAYLQYFCGYKAYDDSKPPLDPSLMVYFRKRLTPEILGEINEMILAAQNSDDDDSDDGDGNGGTMIVAATCAPSQIKYPQDTALLNEARENTEALIDALHTPGTKKPRTYRKRAHKDYLALVRSRKPGQKKIRKAIGKQLHYLARNLKSIDALRTSGGTLSARQQLHLETIQKVYEQQKSMYDRKSHQVSDRIVSLSQPWLRPIVRGKAKAAVEFGTKLDISVVNGWTRLETFSFNSYSEAAGLPDAVERYRERTGRYPARRWAGRRRTQSWTKTELQGRMRACGSGAPLFSGKAVLRSGPDYSQTARNRLPLHCHVHSAAESQKDSARSWGFLALPDTLALRADKIGFCSVDISLNQQGRGDSHAEINCANVLL